MGEYGYRNVSFCKNVKIFGGGSKAEVLYDSTVWGVKYGKDYKCFCHLIYKSVPAISDFERRKNNILL